jgi:protoporphyrinogen oxidase
VEKIKSIIIIGAGPAGLTAAYEISKNQNFKITILEKSNYLGGMARSFELFGQIVDLGPHRFFSNDTRVNKLWLEVIGKDYKMVNRVTRIFYKKRFFDYPLKPTNALFNLGLFETLFCLFSYFRYKLFPNPNTTTFEGWVTNRFGKRLYNIFFKGYTEKLWGIPCDKLTSEFAQQRIKKFSLGEAILNALKLKNNKNHKTLVDQFAYPLKGNGFVYEKMANILSERGINICYNQNIIKITNSSNQFVIETNEIVYESDFLISSMPITNFFKIFNLVDLNLLESVNKLIFRNTIVAYVKLNSEDLFIDQWLYIQDEKILTGRITNFNNWVTDIKMNTKGTVLALEYWCYDSDAIWNIGKEEMLKIVVKDLIICGFIKNINEVVDFDIIKVPKCYPVYNTTYKPHLQNIINFSNTINNLQFIGRYGSFKYNNQDHSILMGMLAARNILYNEKNNIWDINTDYEYHESSTITSTGLLVEKNI